MPTNWRRPSSACSRIPSCVPALARRAASTSKRNSAWSGWLRERSPCTKAGSRRGRYRQLFRAGGHGLQPVPHLRLIHRRPAGSASHTLIPAYLPAAGRYTDLRSPTPTLMDRASARAARAFQGTLRIALLRLVTTRSHHAEVAEGEVVTHGVGRIHRAQ